MLQESMPRVYSDAAHEGFGKVYSMRQQAFANAETIPDMCYEHKQFTKIGHGQNVKELEAFTNLSSTCKPDDKSKLIETRKVSRNPSFTPEVRKNLRKMYDATEKPQIEPCDYTIHVRRGDVNEKNWPERWLPDEFYTDMIGKIKDKQPDSDVCVVTESKTDLYEKAGARVIRTGLKESYHHMVTSKNLIVSYSALSGSAGLLNENKVWFPDTSQHPRFASESVRSKWEEYGWSKLVL